MGFALFARTYVALALASGVLAEVIAGGSALSHCTADIGNATVTLTKATETLFCASTRLSKLNHLSNRAPACPTPEGTPLCPMGMVGTVTVTKPISTISCMFCDCPWHLHRVFNNDDLLACPALPTVRPQPTRPSKGSQEEPSLTKSPGAPSGSGPVIIPTAGAQRAGVHAAVSIIPWLYFVLLV